MITISLCMIVKNEEAVLSRILEQVKNIADEIIIVDTGSDDQTKAVAKNYTELVFDYPWKQDFADARNFACSKATMDYWMWLDADDFIPVQSQEKLLALKNTLDPETDLVMMKYITGFDENGNGSFHYYRERLMKNKKGFLWKGKVHEAVIPAGTIFYVPIEIEHRKIKPGDPDRNLAIYQEALKNGIILEPRHQFYYGRELYFHEQYEEAADVLEKFLREPEGWLENQIDACLHLSYCYEKLGKREKSLTSLFNSFSFDVPRAEICCEIGRLKMEENSLHQAVFWYEQAAACKPHDSSGAFIQKDCYDFVPFIQLCVCYDKLGDRQTARTYHKRSQKIKPDSEAVRFNEAYFQNLPE